jgi:hypothetical protein
LLLVKHPASFIPNAVVILVICLLISWQSIMNMQPNCSATQYDGDSEAFFINSVRYIQQQAAANITTSLNAPDRWFHGSNVWHNYCESEYHPNHEEQYQVQQRHQQSHLQQKQSQRPSFAKELSALSRISRLQHSKMLQRTRICQAGRRRRATTNNQRPARPLLQLRSGWKTRIVFLSMNQAKSSYQQVSLRQLHHLFLVLAPVSIAART